MSVAIILQKEIVCKQNFHAQIVIRSNFLLNAAKVDQPCNNNDKVCNMHLLL